jgi:hypothetical protein
MKVKIGPFLNYWGPYQIAEALFFWVKKYDSEYEITDGFRKVEAFGDWLANDRHGGESKFAKLCEYVHSKRSRSVKIRIDSYDTWNLDDTLSLIILPLLKQLKHQKQGAPFTDDCDVPIWLHSTLKPAERPNDIDGNHHERWDWILDEMIWAFEQKCDPNSDSKFFIHHDRKDDSIAARISSIEIDRVGLMKHEKRVENGERLFGKYFSNLWS